MEELQDTLRSCRRLENDPGMHPGGWAHDTRPDRSAGTNYANNLGTVDGVDGVQPNLATARLISAGGRRCRVAGMEHVSVGAGVGVVCPSSAAGRGGRVALARLSLVVEKGW